MLYIPHTQEGFCYQVCTEKPEHQNG